MPQIKPNLDELATNEALTRREWEKAVQQIKIANEAVGVAHRKWLAAVNALDNAKAAKKETEFERPKFSVAKSR